MSGEERKQFEAILVAAAVICLWLSSAVPIWIPGCPGNYDLQKILQFWNKPLWINWPAAVILFIAGAVAGNKLQRGITARKIQKQQEEARHLSGKGEDNAPYKEFREIF